MLREDFFNEFQIPCELCGKIGCEETCSDYLNDDDSDILHECPFCGSLHCLGECEEICGMCDRFGCDGQCMSRLSF